VKWKKIRGRDRSEGKEDGMEKLGRQSKILEAANEKKIRGRFHLEERRVNGNN
jgi:hypothetical protein